MPERAQDGPGAAIGGSRIYQDPRSGKTIVGPPTGQIRAGPFSGDPVGPRHVLEPDALGLLVVPDELGDLHRGGGVSSLQRVLIVALELGKVGCSLPPAYGTETGDQVRAVFDGAAAPAAQIANR